MNLGTHIQILKYPRISTPMKFLQTRTVELHMEITKAVFGGFSFPEHLFPMQTWNGWRVGHWPFVSGIHKCMRTWLSLESINQIDDFRGSILLYLADKFDKDGKFFPKDRAAGSLFWWSPEKLEGFLWPADMNPSIIFFGGYYHWTQVGNDCLTWTFYKFVSLKIEPWYWGLCRLRYSK